jgi:hypothetical protein
VCENAELRLTRTINRAGITKTVVVTVLQLDERTSNSLAVKETAPIHHSAAVMSRFQVGTISWSDSRKTASTSRFITDYSYKRMNFGHFKRWRRTIKR